MNGSGGRRALAIRWLKFNAVGLIGVGAQLASLCMLNRIAHLNYLVATGLAVEIAVLHNFVWHEHFTWKDRAGGSARQRWVRLLRFNLSNGGISIAGNLLLMRLLTGALHMHVMPANLIAIAALSLANFTVSHTFVFRAGSGPA